MNLLLLPCCLDVIVLMPIALITLIGGERSRLLAGRSRDVPWGITWTFLVIVMIYPWLIPWRQLFT
ncbi:MAG: hypothetical protein U0903_14260 [Planctomycetales bacterium]